MPTISFNPALMTAPQNTFLLDTQGFIQGITQDDWASSAWLLSGTVDAAIAQPVWGGMGILADTPAAVTNNRSGPDIKLAATTGISGFTVFDKGINFIQVPGNTAPTVQAGQDVPFYLFGSNARVPLPISGTAASFEGISINTPLFWDTVAFALTIVSNANTVALPAGVRLMALNAGNSKTVSYNASTGAVSWLVGQNCAVIAI